MENSTPNKEEIERFSVSVPKDIYESFEHVRKVVGISRSQAIRNSMHLFIEKESKNLEPIKQGEDKFVLATINLLMKHSDWGITHSHSHEKMHYFSPHIASDDHHEHEHPHLNEEIDEQENDFLNNNEKQEPNRYIGILEADFLKNNEIQHEFHDVIVSVTHIHAEHDLCMEILVTKGSMYRIQALYSKLRTLKSVLDIRLFITISENLI